MSKEILNLHLDDIRVHAPTGGAAGQVPTLNSSATALEWKTGFNGFTMMPGSFTASSNGTTNCPIGIPTYDYTSDYLMVVYLNQYMISGVEYSLNVNHTSIDLIGFSLTAGETIYFQVLKSIVSVPQATFSGNLITAGTVPDTAMVNMPAWSMISDTTLGSDSKSINISGLSAYKLLRLSIIGATSYTGGLDSILVRFNDDVTSSYYYTWKGLYGGSSYGGTSSAVTSLVIYQCLIPVAYADSGYIELSIPNMAATKTKRLVGSSSNYAASGWNGDGYIHSGQWTNVTSAITKITLTAESGNFKAGSRFIVTGVK